MIVKLGTEGIIDNDTANLLQKFWDLRNQLIHDHRFEIKKLDYIAFNDIGIRILKILNVLNNDLSDGGKVLPHYKLD
jgi:hypothetical protein